MEKGDKINMLLVAFGTRPEYIKLLPLFKYWKFTGFNEWKIWLTYQHKELCYQLSENTWEFHDHILSHSKYSNWNTDYNKYDYNDFELDRLSSIIVGQLVNSNVFGPLSLFDAILVQGDTASAYACALSAYNQQIPIIHLEAGLRSFDNKNPYPEEGFRRMISAISSINLCPTWKNKQNLENEKAPGMNFIVGNTVIDNIKNIEASFNNEILITLHRRESINEIEKWFSIIEQLAEEYKEYKFILPIHKNPEIYKYKSMFKNVNCIEPLEHSKFINKLAACRAIISDSGGVIEEASYFGKTIFLCRKETERPEAFQFYIKCPTPEELYKNFNLKINSFSKNLELLCPFGDGNTSKYITDILIREEFIKINEIKD